MNGDDELADFKLRINLVEYAESVGYVIDRSASSRGSTVMRLGDDKVIIATDQDGHGIYFSVRDDADHGSIIDFVQRRDGANLGQVRKTLRPWIGGVPAYFQPVAPAVQHAKPPPSSTDRQRVVVVWSKMMPTGGRHPYLESRGIEPATLVDPRFAGAMRIDGKRNALFPHYDSEGLSGYELKNAGFTAFATGGQKALWHSTNIMQATTIVFTESAIDALSHAQLQTDPSTAYVSVGGQMNSTQPELVRRLLAKAHARGARIVIGIDHDAAGDLLSAVIIALAPPGAAIERDTSALKDWYDDLRHSLAAMHPAAPPAPLEEEDPDRSGMKS